jgi:hypothetical protein
MILYILTKRKLQLLIPSLVLFSSLPNMRRIASVLASKRSDKPDTPQRCPPHVLPPNSSTRRFFGTLTRITVSTDRSSQPTASEPAHSSSASSTGSVSLRTPEDDRIGPCSCNTINLLKEGVDPVVDPQEIRPSRSITVTSTIIVLARLVGSNSPAFHSC